MNGILEHVVHKVRRRLDEVIDSLEHLQVLPLLLVEQVELVLILVELHSIDGLLEVVPLILDHLFSLLDFFLLFLQLFYLLVDLLLHHLEQVLVLDLELVHDTSEGLLELVDLLVELLANLVFKL